MRSLVLAALLAAVISRPAAADGVPLLSFDLFSLSGVSRSLSGEDLRLACVERDDDGLHQRRWCRPSIGAVLDTLDAVERLQPTARIYCPEVRPVPWQDAARIYVAWAEAHPDRLQAPSVWPLLAALREAYPCPDRAM